MTDKEYQHALDLMIQGAKADERAKTIDEFVKMMSFCCMSSSFCFSEKKCSECEDNAISEKEVLRIAEQLKEQIGE